MQIIVYRYSSLLQLEGWECFKPWQFNTVSKLGFLYLRSV